MTRDVEHESKLTWHKNGEHVRGAEGHYQFINGEPVVGELPNVGCHYWEYVDDDDYRLQAEVHRAEVASTATSFGIIFVLYPILNIYASLPAT